MTWRWTVLVVLLAGVFVGLRGIHALAEPPDDSAIFTDKVVVVGVTGRYTLTPIDRAVLGGHLGDVQVGVISIRPRYIGDCAAAGWATLGAGRRTSVAGRCRPQIAGKQVPDWPARLAAAAARSGDAQLGTLAATVPGCVSAVGPGAALAAARPDGSLAQYETAEAFLNAGTRVTCPITLVDAGQASDAIISRLAKQPDVTLFVTGIGPEPGSTNPDTQLVYRLGTTFPGWLTSASTRRHGVVTLVDLTRTLIEFGGGTDLSHVDGAPLQVEQDSLTIADIEGQLRAVSALSDAVVTGYLTAGIGGAVVVLGIVASIARRRFQPARVLLAVSAVMSAAMILSGAVPWYAAPSPGLFLSLLLGLWVVILVAATFLLSRSTGAPVAAVAAALTVAVVTADAALGGVMQPGSMLNSRPSNGGRWYGFGNVTFAAYAAAGLVLAGYVAHRLRRSGHPVAAVVGAAVIGFGIVICEGWPSMGTDFGGVIALMPAVLWMLLALSGARVTWLRLLALGGGAVVAIALISWLDWRRGPSARSHLGNFVQRIIDGDAVSVVVRKGAAAVQSLVSPVGIAVVLLGVAAWLIIFKRLLPLVTADFSTIRTVATAVLGTAILGTLLNDGGSSVWLTMTAAFSITIASLWVDRAAESSVSTPSSVADGQLARPVRR